MLKVPNAHASRSLSHMYIATKVFSNLFVHAHVQWVFDVTVWTDTQISVYYRNDTALFNFNVVCIQIHWIVVCIAYTFTMTEANSTATMFIPSFTSLLQVYSFFLYSFLASSAAAMNLILPSTHYNCLKTNTCEQAERQREIGWHLHTDIHKYTNS